MTEQEISEMVVDAGERLKEMILEVQLNDRPSAESLKNHPNKADCAFDYPSYVSELESIECDLNAAYSRLTRLRNRFTTSQMTPYGNGTAIYVACKNTAKTLVEVGQEKERIHREHSPKTRELIFQKWATDEAANIVGINSRKLRSVAYQIMEVGGLETNLSDGKLKPSKATLTLWISEIRQFAK